MFESKRKTHHSDLNQHLTLTWKWKPSLKPETQLCVLWGPDKRPWLWSSLCSLYKNAQTNTDFYSAVLGYHPSFSCSHSSLIFLWIRQNCASLVPSSSRQAPRQQKNVGSVCGKCLSHPAKVWQKEKRFICLDLLEIIVTIFSIKKMKKVSKIKWEFT